MIRQMHEWLAEHTDFVQYPRPRRIYPQGDVKPVPPGTLARALMLLIIGSIAVIFGVIVLIAALGALKVMFFG